MTDKSETTPEDRGAFMGDDGGDRKKGIVATVRDNKVKSESMRWYLETTACLPPKLAEYLSELFNRDQERGLPHLTLFLSNLSSGTIIPDTFTNGLRGHIDVARLWEISWHEIKWLWLFVSFLVVSVILLLTALVNMSQGMMYVSFVMFAGSGFFAVSYGSQRKNRNELQLFANWWALHQALEAFGETAEQAKTTPITTQAKGADTSTD